MVESKSELQRQSMEIERTQQDISSLKKQLSQLRGLFKGKERKSLEGKIELLEDLEKRLHKSLEQIVKREGYPNVQAFQKVIRNPYLPRPFQLVAGFAICHLILLHRATPNQGKVQIFQPVQGREPMTAQCPIRHRSRPLLLDH